jgi:hypothetical protein
VVTSLTKAYASLRIGTPLDSDNHMGPLIDTAAVADYRRRWTQVAAQGGKVLYGGQVMEGPAYASGCYVQPTLCEVKNDYPIVQEETFAPILYLIRYRGDVTNAIAIQNDVPQGLSSAIFTNDLRETEQFLSAVGSDCGIANVNIGTSGAEIGGAFGGEKENRRWAGIRLRCMEGVHAPTDQHHQLRPQPAPGPGNCLRSYRWFDRSQSDYPKRCLLHLCRAPLRVSPVRRQRALFSLADGSPPVILFAWLQSLARTTGGEMAAKTRKVSVKSKVWLEDHQGRIYFWFRPHADFKRY